MTRSQATIRPAETRDVETMAALLAELFDVEEDFQGDAKRQLKGLGMLLESDQAIVLVAEVQGEVVGMCTGQTLISTAEGGPALLVEDVVIDQKFRQRGIGRQLLESIADKAGRHSISRLQLLADRNNSAALDFYRKTGWNSTDLICLRSRVP
ncbi:N-acetyltransferase family protein [Desulfosediminicola sp.]|uniref:GNAT family N-acetyltransferase n=1 Tax=Desulfosediminicola sp. TaxID=2886825 RepID=UPI003AF2AA8C